MVHSSGGGGGGGGAGTGLVIHSSGTGPVVHSSGGGGGNDDDGYIGVGGNESDDSFEGFSKFLPANGEVNSAYYKAADLNHDPDDAELYEDTRLAHLTSMSLAIAMAAEASEIQTVGKVGGGGGAAVGMKGNTFEEVMDGAGVQDAKAVAGTSSSSLTRKNTVWGKK
jgi:hypothetical protein